MNKKTFCIFISLILCFSTVTFAYATGSSADTERVLPRLMDYSDILSDGEKGVISITLDEISERQQVDVAIVTVNSLDGKSSMEYADDFYDQYGYGFGVNHDGILLLIAMDEHEYWITTCGYAITAFTDSGLDQIKSHFEGYLSNGDYQKAFSVFAADCDDYITQAKTGMPYDTNNIKSEPINPFLGFVFCLGFALIAAFIIVTVIKGKLKSVKMAQNASGYIRSGSVTINRSFSRFIRSDVSRVAKPKSTSGSGGGSSTHIGSSGTSHGGSGGRF